MRLVIMVEHFLGVVHVSDTSAQTLKNNIDDFFAINGLSISRLRDQGYDGVSNMRGEFNGLKQKNLDESKHAYYVHCFAHQLQLVLVTTTKKNGHVKDVVLQKHYDDLVKCLESGEVATGKGKNQETSLARSVTYVFDTIFEDANEVNSRGIARNLIDKMLQFEFVFIAHLMVTVLAKTYTLSMYLPQRTQNIVTSVRMIKTINDELKKYRNDNDCWEELLCIVTAFCTKNDIFVPNMQDPILGRGRAKLYRSIDGQLKTYYHFFRRDIFFEVLDLIVKEMDDRFTESSTELVMCISCLDPRYSFVNFDRN
ncbi:hypothetical protein M9H77_03339 [Catharanthus roseus]|uniref:Uncharacterized protein n=1 Tax=Catharanthus roseus TaxID=4058 RepID=A0ACC0CB21_CATRO|nr:hypothetical protein M9H77_03339 [Catharanthus roseus]